MVETIIAFWAGAITGGYLGATWMYSLVRAQRETIQSMELEIQRKEKKLKAYKLLVDASLKKKE